MEKVGFHSLFVKILETEPGDWPRSEGLELGGLLPRALGSKPPRFYQL